MPPVLSTHRLRDHADQQCRRCRQDFPPIDGQWNVQRRMCVGCARTNPLTIRLPARQRCSLCTDLFPPAVFCHGPDERHPTRCPRCRVRERCTKCRKIKRRRQFLRPSCHGVDEGRPLLLTCSKCRTKSAACATRKRQAAEATGMLLNSKKLAYTFAHTTSNFKPSFCWC